MRIVGLPVIGTVTTVPTIILAVLQTLVEVIHGSALFVLFVLFIRWNVAEAVFVAVNVSKLSITALGLLVISAVTAVQTVLFAITQTLVEVVHGSALFGWFIRWNVPEAVFVAVKVSKLGITALWLLVVGAVTAVLTIKLAVLQTLLEEPSHAVPIAVLVLVLIPVLILRLALRCGRRSSNTGRAEPGEGHSNSQHPYGLL